VDELTDDAIAGAFRVWQRRRGHRYSLDDVATAWEAARARPGAPRCLDLGCGLGSVLLMLAYRMPAARFVGVEAQEVSMALARDNVDRNGLSGRVRLVGGDLRDPGLLDGTSPFDLVTGTPPYTPPQRGSVSPDPQRAHARMELRGGVEDYLEAAARVLAPGGRVVVCADARRPDRVRRGAAAGALVPLAFREVVPRAARKGPLFTVWILARAGDAEAAEPARLETLVARDADGGRTRRAHDLRRFFGLPVDETEPASP